MFEARFQSFEDAAERAASAPRVAALRTELARRGLSGFIVPRADRHQNEYVPAAEERLAWLTGFTGSAGAAGGLIGRAAPFVAGRVTLHDVRYAGEEAATKPAQIRPEIGKLRAAALVVSDPHAVAWTFNIRGSDVAHTPLPLAFAVVPREGRPALYVDGRKLSNEVRYRLEGLADLREPPDLPRDLAALGEARKTVRLRQATAADALAR